MMELTDSLWTMYSENADDSAYATKLWYPGTMCDSIDEESGDTLVDELFVEIQYTMLEHHHLY